MVQNSCKCLSNRQVHRWQNDTGTWKATRETWSRWGKSYSTLLVMNHINQRSVFNHVSGPQWHNLNECMQHNFLNFILKLWSCKYLSQLIDKGVNFHLSWFFNFPLNRTNYNIFPVNPWVNFSYYIITIWR